nr:hypothetical protein [Tanacetum cinerariifolium]
VKGNQEKDKIGSKPNKKREAWRSREKFKAVTVDRGRKTKQNAKRRAVNANTVKSYSSFKRKKEGDGEVCQRCTCTRYGSGLSKGLCLICGNNQNSLNDSPSISENSPQNPPHIDERCYECGDTKFNRYSFFETPKVLLLAWDRVFEIKDAFGNKQYKPKDSQELFRKLLNDVQNIHKELAEYINTPGWNHPAFYNNGDVDDVDYKIAITPVLSTEEPDNSLSMGDEHLDTIPLTESDEVIKSSVEDLVLIPSESEGIPDTMCNVHLVNNPTPLEAKDHFEIFINSNDDYSSSDDDSLYNENIEYVEASPHDYELVSLEVAEIVIPKDEEIEDDNLREKLLNVNLVIAKIEALKDNPTSSSELLTKSSSTSPKSFLEETNTFDNSLPEFKNFCFDLEEISSSSTTTHSDISLSDYEAFYFYDDHIEEISNGSTTTHSDISLSDYEAFYFYDDHIEEISNGSTTTHSDISLSEYDSFIFDLANDQFPPTDRSGFTHEEFTDELAYIISPPEYDCFYFRNLPDLDVLRAEEACKLCTCAKCGSGLGKGLFYICRHNQNSLNDSPSISETSSQSPSNINHYFYECGDPLDGIFCKRCTCKSCGKDAHIGYNCPSKVPVISNQEPCNNQTIDELPQTLPIFHPTFHSKAESPLTLDSTPTYVDESPNIFNPPPQPPVYPCEFCGNDAYYGHYCTPQAPFIYLEPCYNQDFNFP